MRILTNGVERRVVVTATDTYSILGRRNIHSVAEFFATRREIITTPKTHTPLGNLEKIQLA